LKAFDTSARLAAIKTSLKRHSSRNRIQAKSVFGYSHFTGGSALKNNIIQCFSSLVLLIFTSLNAHSALISFGRQKGVIMFAKNAALANTDQYLVVRVIADKNGRLADKNNTLYVVRTYGIVSIAQIDNYLAALSKEDSVLLNDEQLDSQNQLILKSEERQRKADRIPFAGLLPKVYNSYVYEKIHKDFTENTHPLRLLKASLRFSIYLYADDFEKFEESIIQSLADIGPS
jgi:hypothetical protein